MKAQQLLTACLAGSHDPKALVQTLAHDLVPECALAIDTEGVPLRETILGEPFAHENNKVGRHTLLRSDRPEIGA
jgi:hypothetical protein